MPITKDPRIEEVFKTWSLRMNAALKHMRVWFPHLPSESFWDTGMQNLALSVKVDDKLYVVRMSRWLDGNWSCHHTWNGETTWEQALASHNGDIYQAVSCLFVYCFQLTQ